jgi:hypothetical protein
MSTRFEILKNGKRVCITGINGDGVLSVNVNYVKHLENESSHDLHIGGLGRFDGSQDNEHHASWPAPKITTGDEITIRILPPGEFDEPRGMTFKAKKTLDDPELGKVSFYINSWTGNIAFDAPPIESANFRICAEEKGPTQEQRKLLRDLPSRHQKLWPDICSAILKCHPEIETSNELCNRLATNVFINIADDSNTIELAYRVEGDPEFRNFIVRLRESEIAEVFTVD